MKPTKKTGEQWNEIINRPKNITIVAPDGWDRTNDSYQTEKITEKEFHKRSLRSSHDIIAISK